MTAWQKRRRFSRTAGYTLVALCGVCSIVWPPPTVKAAASPLLAVAFIWSLLLAVGGALSAVSSARGGWQGEYVGLWPLITSLMVFSLATSTSGRGMASAAGALLLAGIAFVMYARWTDVAALRREALSAHRDARDDRGLI